MPKRSRKSNQGCCLGSLVLWPFQLLENLVNSLNISSINQKTQPTARKKAKSPTGQKGGNTGRFVDVTPAGTQKFIPSLGVSITYENRGISFVNDAQKFRNKSETSTVHAPFKCYWPTYRDMNGPQQQWYFYWRSQVRRDNYLPTDLSYIFVHIYEILNLVETPDPGQAAARIRSLWLAYRETYPNLDRYLPDWAGDLVAVKVGTPQALEWWATIMSMDGLIIPNSVINTMVENALQTNALEVLPYKIWSLISDYQPKNKFYQKYNTNGSIDLAYGKAILVANSYYLQITEKTLIDQFVSERIHHYDKHVFASALVGIPYPKIVRLGSGRDYAGSTILAGNITSIMKYAENILRKQQKFSAKLSGIELPPKLAQQLDEAFLPAKTEPRQPEPIKITIDHERVASLHQESQIVSEMLATKQDSVEKELLTDLKEARTLWKLLNHSERLVLAGLFNKELMTASQVEKLIDDETEKVVSILGSINQKSLSALGDKIVYETAGTLNLAEDFLDELEVIISEAPPSKDVSVAESTDDILDPWVQFFDDLEPVEVELTKILGRNGQLDETELDAIARMHNAMGMAAMDSLNEKAQVYLNQLPFYLEGTIWLVEEEYLPILQQHLGIEVN